MRSIDIGGIDDQVKTDRMAENLRWIRMSNKDLEMAFLDDYKSIPVDNISSFQREDHEVQEKEDLRKQYAECKDISPERRAMIDKFLDDEAWIDYERRRISKRHVLMGEMEADDIKERKDYAITVKTQSKSSNIGHKIGSLHQKPNQRAFFYNHQANKAKCQKIESSRVAIHVHFLHQMNGSDQNSRRIENRNSTINRAIVVSLDMLLDAFLSAFSRTTCSWKEDGHCNRGNFLGSYIVGNTLRYQNLEWYEALKDSELKEEALRNKAIMEGLINDDVGSNNEGWKSWKNFENTNDDHYEREYESDQEDKERCELFNDAT
nr:NAC domain-containing protein 86-like [Tanacetum cinerariifolium]